MCSNCSLKSQCLRYKRHKVDTFRSTWTRFTFIGLSGQFFYEFVSEKLLNFKPFPHQNLLFIACLLTYFTGNSRFSNLRRSPNLSQIQRLGLFQYSFENGNETFREFWKMMKHFTKRLSKDLEFFVKFCGKEAYLTVLQQSICKIAMKECS